MTLVRWAGFLLVAGALAVLPFAAWVSARWGIVSATAGAVGVLLTLLSRRRAPPE